MMMQLQDKAAAEEKFSPIAQAREGLGFIRHNQVVRTLLTMVAVSNIFAVGYMSLMPAFAQDVLGEGPAGLGFLSSAMGAGALIGALVVASLGKSKNKGLFLTAGNLFLPTMVLLFSTSRVFPLSLIIVFFAGIGFMVQNSMTNTLIQIAVPDHLRGRVMSVFTLVFMGFFPIGALIAGTVAEQSTIPLGAAFGGSIALIFGLIWLWRAPYIRQLA
jgi:predicted MFS family arabinose efflux permease